MEFNLSTILTGVQTLAKKLFSLILKKCGKKIVPFDNYNQETVEVGIDYPSESEKCKQEEKKGAQFYWSEKYSTGYEKYYETEGNTQRYFKCQKMHLWIERPNKKEN